jgi:ribosomal protein S18 acetylase RimI-like enzyme
LFHLKAVLNQQLLDNPIWNALDTEHRTLSLGDRLARTYRADIGPLSGLADDADAAYETLRALAGPGGMLGLFLQQPYSPRRGWTLFRDGLLAQMIFAESYAPAHAELPSSADMRPLTAANVDAMVELARLTEPGPFRRRTAELGTFYGIFEADRLVAMAGQRMRMPGFVEVSAVCTHPDARGKGYAAALIAAVVAQSLREDRVPFLHALAENTGAIRVYERLGFTHRRTLHLAVLKNDE